MNKPNAAMLVSELLGRRLGRTPTIAIRAWDGSTTGQDNVPRLVLRTPRALTRILYRPGQLGFARAFITGEADVEGDLPDFLRRVPAMILNRPVAPREVFPALRTGLRLKALGLPPKRPTQEVRRRLKAADSIAHHYDVSNDFYALILGESMVYSCAYWPAPPDANQPEASLNAAQQTKLDLICQKLALRPGMRLLDVGCGWGSLTEHAVTHYGVTATGVTLSAEGALYATRRLAAAGLSDRTEIRLSDFRDIHDEPFDAIASIEISQHVPARALPEYSRTLYRLIKPGGTVLDHHINVQREGHILQGSPFLHAYIFPDLHVAPLHRTLRHHEEAGFEITDVENLRQHFGPTFRAWLNNLNTHWDQAVRLIGPPRARAWRLYLASIAMAQETGWAGINHITATRPHPTPSGAPTAHQQRPAAPRSALNPPMHTGETRDKGFPGLTSTN